jgi:hypothetical protein
MELEEGWVGYGFSCGNRRTGAKETTQTRTVIAEIFQLTSS